MKEIASLLHRYGLSEVRGDKYPAGWVRQAFEREGIRYRDADMDKSTAYLEAEPVFTQGRVELLDHPQLVRELTLLERRPRAQGRVLIDHPHGGHDDFANVTCLAIALLAKVPLAPMNFYSSGQWLVEPPGPTPSLTHRLMERTSEIADVVTDVLRGAACKARSSKSPLASIRL